LRYVNCGHPAGLVIRGGRVAAALEATAAVIGVLPDLDVEVGEIELERGDLVVLYSDGASEPFAGEDGLGGEDRLLELIGEAPGRGAEEVAERLAWMQGEQADDITVMLARAV
jgi:serine phosphatase RsbU (regulator of sigma subunit)